MINIALVFGGPSTEHEVSLMSAQNIYKALDKEKYKIHLIGIDKNADWQYIEHCKNISKLKLCDDSYPKILFSPHGDKKLIVEGVEGKSLVIDIFFPALHGNYGEDGVIQGIFKALDIPFVGASLEASAVCMNKILASNLFVQSGLTTIPQIEIFANQDKSDLNYANITEQLGSPIFIKPSSAGSSVGVSKVSSKEELDFALKDAFQYDNKIIIQKAISGIEVEVAVMGNDDKDILVSTPGALKSSDFYSYDEKYKEDSTEFFFPAPLNNTVLSKIKDLAKTAYQSVHCCGFARVDFFVNKINGENKIYINEINTLPGFTNISMFPKLFEYDGIDNKTLVDKLIAFGFDQYKKINKLKKTYNA